MNFIQNLVKNTVNNVETLGTKAKAAVNTLSGSASGSPSATSPTEGEGGDVAAATVAYDENAAAGGAVVEDVFDEAAGGEQADGNGENGKNAAGAAAFINTQEVSQKALDGAKSFGSKCGRLKDPPAGLRISNFGYLRLPVQRGQQGGRHGVGHRQADQDHRRECGELHLLKFETLN